MQYILWLLGILGLILLKDSILGFFRSKTVESKIEKFEKSKEVSDEKVKLARSAASAFLERLRNYRASKK